MNRGAADRFTALLLVTGVAAAGGGCDGSRNGATKGAPVDAATDGPAPQLPDAQAGPGRVDAGATCPGATPPADLPDGWVPWDVYDPCCGFYVPSSAERLPAPIEWEPCSPGVQLPGNVCRQMVENWKPGPDGQFIWPWLSADPGPSGSVLVQLSRAIGPTVLSILADADATVSHAILAATPNVCGLTRGSVRDGRFAYHVAPQGAGVGGGVLSGGTDDLVPTRWARLDDGKVHELIAGGPGVLDTATMQFFADPSWPSPRPIATPGGLGAYDQVFIGDALFWNASNVAEQKNVVWTSSSGSRELMAFGGDPSQGAADLGGDGHDLVWLYGSQRTDPSGLFPRVDIMTAPFTTDAAHVVARRLRSEVPNGFGVSPFVVGCGYAARAAGYGTRVTRLSDGASWVLSGDPSRAGWWTTPLALSCTELFAKVGVRSDGSFRSTLARVRLDSLGTSTPPD